MKKNLTWIFIVIIAILCSCTNPEYLPEVETEDEEITYINPSLMWFTFEKQIEFITDGIVIGTVFSVNEEIVYDLETNEMFPSNFIQFNIEQVISGDFHEQSIINIFENGNGKTYVYSPTMKTGGYLKMNDKVLLFLVRADEYSEESIRFSDLHHLTPAYMFHPYHGRIWLDENGEIDLEKNAFEGSFVIQDESEMMYSSSEGRTTGSQEGTRTSRQGETLDEFIGRIEAALADERSVAEIAGDVGVGEARREE